MFFDRTFRCVLIDCRRLYRRMQFSVQFSATFQNATPRSSVSDVHPVECERYRRANRHERRRRYRETADVDVANAKEKPRNLANVYHADSCARRPPRISHALPAVFAFCIAMENRRGNFELITRCNSSWFALHRCVSVMDRRSFLFQHNVRITC